MNSIIAVDLNKDILLETDISPTADKLLALVCEQPFLINVTLKQTLPRIKRYAEDNFGCNIDSLYNRRAYFSRGESKTFCKRQRC